MTPGLVLEPLADDALLLRLSTDIDTATNARIVQLVARIRAAHFPWLRDVVPAYSSLAVFFDVDAFAGNAHREIGALLMKVASQSADAPREGTVPGIHEIPVHYGGRYGPDLYDCAHELGLSVDDIVARHVGVEYTVAMIGFAPGFPYLLGLDPSLALPRLATPRTRAPAGSVAIGGAQTGIYPRESAGGWRLIGRTPLRLFDPARDAPSLLQAGDRVRFVAVDSGSSAAFPA